MMDSIAEIVSYLTYGRAALLESIEGLSHRELTEIPIYEGWTVKDVLAHIVGWDQRVIKTIPLMVAGRAHEVPGVDVQEHNQAAVAAWKDATYAEVLAEILSTHDQILEMIGELDHTEIDRRHQRGNRVVTIRSYVIEIMVDHERRHAAEIEQWRKELDQNIDLPAIASQLQHSRAAYMELLDRFTDADVMDKSAVDGWSLTDVVGHLADWEQRMLKAAQHIHDPSQPPVRPVGESSADWNEILAARRADKSWAENYHYLRETQVATEDFVLALRVSDCRLRGPYPWPDDQGTLAELLQQIAEHYDDHIPELERWYKARHP